MTLVALEQVTKTYGTSGAPDARTVLDGAELAIAAGAMEAIIGPSGCGKSTALNLLGALDVPSAGRVVFQGQDLAGLTQADLATFRSRHVGFIFQDHHLLPQCTVRENVLLPTLAGGGRADAAAIERANTLLGRVGLGDRATDWPHHLSGGERQRVAVVRALINRPELVLADEPTGALDERTADELVTLLIELNRDEGAALVVVTHQKELAARMERIHTLHDGRFQTA